MNKWKKEVRKIYVNELSDFLAKTQASNSSKTLQFIQKCIVLLGIPCIDRNDSEILICSSKVNSTSYQINLLAAPNFSEKEVFLEWVISQLDELQRHLEVRCTAIREINSEVQGKIIS